MRGGYWTGSVGVARRDRAKWDKLLFGTLAGAIRKQINVTDAYAHKIVGKGSRCARLLQLHVLYTGRTILGDR